jgi:chromosome segregation protein
MRIKTLEMSGFKSFSDRTIVQFEEGVTGVVGPNGCGKCVHGDTMIPLADGNRVTIRALVESALDGAESVSHMDDGEYTYDNPSGIKVLSLNTRTLKMEEREVLAFVRRTSPAELVRVKTRSGRSVTATKYHPFFIQEGTSVRAVRADELRVGLRVASPRGLPVKASTQHFASVLEHRENGGSELVAVDNMLVTGTARMKPLKVVSKVTPEWGRFLGYVISEGQNSRSVDHVRFVNGDKTIVEDYCRLSETLFGMRPTIGHYKKNAVDCLLYSKILCDLLDRNFGIERGGHSSTKSIPSLIFASPDEVVWEFISALIEGDGCIRIDRSNACGKVAAYVEYATASEELARGLAALFLRFGIRSFVREKEKRATNSSGPLRTYYSVYVYGAENLKRLDKGLRLVSFKREKLHEAAHLTVSASYLDVIPDVTGEFSALWDECRASVDRDHPLRGRIEAYREGRCRPSRRGLTEAIDYMRANAGTWNRPIEEKAARLERLAGSDIYWDEIMSVENMPGEDWVYDLCVEETHNFVADDLVVHNSNIVDAIRWVMGEMSAKHLRGSAMEDVIFNGCDTRPPVGMSQVFLTFDNSDGRAPAEYVQYSEIQVGRRLYRSGESEYFINKTPCRLKDIVDLFLGTGVGTKAYSIVEQGMVGSLVSAKPEDRRMLIEEAAGISKFKARKEAALRKMESTRQNLARLSDILAELSRQMNSLSRQAKKAERFKKASEELRRKELAMSATKHKRQRGEIENINAELARQREDEVSASAELSSYELELDGKRLAISEMEHELDAASQRLYAAKNSIKLHESEVSHKRAEAASLAQQNAVYAEEIATFRTKLTSMSDRIAAANDAMIDADLRLVGSNELMEALEALGSGVKSRHQAAQSRCDELQRTVISADREIANLTASLDHLERRGIEIAGRIAKAQAEIDGIDARKKDIERDASEREGELANVKQFKLSLLDEAGSLDETLRQHEQNLADADKRISELRDCFSDVRSRLSSIQELKKNLEGYRDGVRAVLTRADSDGRRLEGIRGTVSDLIETDERYETALGAVLGDRLQYVVVKSHEEGVEAIDYLRSAACGRGTFIPVGVRAAGEESRAPEGEGIVGPMKDVVRFDDEYRQICQHLLHGVVLVDDLKRALSLWGTGKFSNTFVTMDGCVVDASGVVTGGAGGGVDEQLVAQKRKERELSEEFARVKAELSVAEAEGQKIREHVKAMRGRADQIGRDAHSEEIKLVGKERDYQRLCDELKRYEHERDKLAVEIAALHEEERETNAEKESVKGRLGELSERHLGASAELVGARAELSAADVELKDYDRRLIELRVGLSQAGERASSAQRELDSLVMDKVDALIGVGRRMADINAANQRIVILNREVDELRSNMGMEISSIGGLEDSQRMLRERYDAEAGSLKGREVEIKDVRRKRDEALEKCHGVEIRLTELRGKMQYLVDAVRERYHLDLPAIETEYACDGMDVEACEAEVEALKERVENIGSVNVDAIAEFQETSERHEFLSRQHGDLTLSLDNLSKAIVKINRTSRQRFKRAFDAVDAQFQELFPKLFNGGRARLMLTDEENLLETGIEIIAQPPGKKLQSITLLSGGEKALTAVALIFSIFLIKPSPFCLLDEVDAPLDDANIDRFNDLIRSMTPHSQFILITHNKRTMELADILYGVTMEEAGVSKMVSVRLGQNKDVETKVA